MYDINIVFNSHIILNILSLHEQYMHHHNVARQDGDFCGIKKRSTDGCVGTERERLAVLSEYLKV